MKHRNEMDVLMRWFIFRLDLVYSTFLTQIGPPRRVWKNLRVRLQVRVCVTSHSVLLVVGMHKRRALHILRFARYATWICFEAIIFPGNLCRNVAIISQY
jgi:hypothetical protein